MKIVVIAHDIRSTHNVGSLMRTCEGLGIDHLYLTGYTPYPKIKGDKRLPHIYEKLTRQIDKTALGAIGLVSWSFEPDIEKLITRLKRDNYKMVALEQANHSVKLPEYIPSGNTALLLGREVEGIDPALLDEMDNIIEIPMDGKKESYNVVQAAAIALYAIKFER